MNKSIAPDAPRWHLLSLNQKQALIRALRERRESERFSFRTNKAKAKKASRPKVPVKKPKGLAPSLSKFFDEADERIRRLLS